jgi:hypothetical protein
MGEPTGSGINFAAASVAATAAHDAETEHPARKVAETSALAQNVTCRQSQGRARDNDRTVGPEGTQRVRRAQNADTLKRAGAREFEPRTRQEAGAERAVLPMSPLAFPGDAPQDAGM